ncbi:hypothetical protein [Actinomadura coerulea]
MPIDSHLLAVFFVSHTARRRLNATVGTLFIGLGIRLAAER